jgi:Family of unknown function (DUF6459)
MGQAWRVTTIDEPVILRALPNYEPKPGTAPPNRQAPQRARLRVVHYEPVEPREDVEPVVKGMVRRLMVVILEALDGRRPLAQLRTQLAPLVFSSIETRVRALASPRTSRLRSLHTCQPARGVIEACGVVDVGPTVRAIAARFELATNSVRCSAFRVL